ncbi:MAG: hypothetical protein QM715_16900 [Nibricoccus sp.]
MKKPPGRWQTVDDVFSKLRIFISWAFLKVMFGAFILTTSCALYALWLHRQDNLDFPEAHTRHLAGLRGQLALTQTARNAAAAELGMVQEEIASHRARASQAVRIAANLGELQTTWKRFISAREQWRINQDSIDKLNQIERDELKAINKLSRPLAQGTTRLEKAERAQRRLEKQLQIEKEFDSPIVHYFYSSWLAGWWVFVGLTGLYFIGPTLRKLSLFYFFAPRIARKRPLLLNRRPGFSPSLGESRNVVETSLWPGESARVRFRYLQSVDDGLVRESKMMMSWRFPITSLLSGFVHDVNFRNARAGRDYRLAFAHHKNPEHQMAVVHVPEGSSLVVRPSFLAAVVLPPGQKLQVRWRWQLFRWQAWLTGQLCFMEFVGPCRLVVAGRPALRAERLMTQEHGATPNCRASVDKIIGFTPGLEYRLVRSPRFWNYYRWDAHLFDAHFSGVGFVLIQNHLPGKTPGLLSLTRNRVRKLIGL